MIVSPSPVAVPVAKVYEVAERPLIVVVAKYPLSTLPDHERLVPDVIRVLGVVKYEDHSVDEDVSGTEYPEAVPSVKVCTPVPVLVVITSDRPAPVEVANVCAATPLPLRVLITPPAEPESVPHENVPSVQISFCVTELQFVSAAP